MKALKPLAFALCILLTFSQIASAIGQVIDESGPRLPALINIELSPNSISPGSEVTVTRVGGISDFNNDGRWNIILELDERLLSENEISLKPTAIISTSVLRFTVPSEIYCGSYRVFVFHGNNLNTANVRSSAQPLEVTSPCHRLPQINSINPDPASYGAAVTLNGINFRDGMVVTLVGGKGPRSSTLLDTSFVSPSQLKLTLPSFETADHFCGNAVVAVNDPSIPIGSKWTSFYFSCPSNVLNVLSWNIKLRPPVPFIVQDPLDRRANAVIDYVRRSSYDVIIFQEAFDDASRNTILEALKPRYPYQTDVLAQNDIYFWEDTRPINFGSVVCPASWISLLLLNIVLSPLVAAFCFTNQIQDGGVVILSKWPIMPPEKYQIFPDCSGEDCFAQKGVLYAKINKEGQPYHLFGTHMDRANSNVRNEQLNTMKSFVDSLVRGTGEPVILAGDFNVRRHSGEYERMLAILDATLPRVDTTNTQTTTRGGSYLDYIFYSTPYLRPVDSYTYNQLRIAFCAPSACEEDGHVSDHHPIFGHFVFPPLRLQVIEDQDFFPFFDDNFNATSNNNTVIEEQDQQKIGQNMNSTISTAD